MKLENVVIRLVLLVAVVTALGVSSTYAQNRANDKPRVSPNATVSQTIGVTPVTITYGRPHVKGREVFGDLVPYGKIWRTGANEATTIDFPKDVTIEGQALPAGTYTLFTIPEESEWTVVFNSVVKQWGAYDYKKSNDVLRVAVEPQTAEHQEMLTFTFEEVTNQSAKVVLNWSTLELPIAVELQ